jgi:hypothetical protein
MEKNEPEPEQLVERVGNKHIQHQPRLAATERAGE